MAGPSAVWALYLRGMKKALLELHVAILLAGFTGVLGRLIAMNEGWLVWYRLLITMIALWVMALFKREKALLPFRTVLPIFGAGAIVAMHWVFFYGSVKYSNVSIALVCFSSMSFFTALLEPLILRRRIDLVEVLLGLLTILGIYLIFHFDAHYKVGIVLGLISSVLSSLFPIYNKRLLLRFSPTIVTRYELTGGWMALTLLMPLYVWLSPASYWVPTWSDWGWLLVLALLCTVLAFNLSVNALKKISPFTVNLSYNLEPVYGILLAFVLYHENDFLNKGFYYGLGIIVATLVLQMIRLFWQQRRRVA